MIQLRPSKIQTSLATAFILVISGFLISCSSLDTGVVASNTADLILTNARVYTLNWDEPALNGTPANNAPYHSEKWQPDAEAVAISEGKILFAGKRAKHYSLETQQHRLSILKVQPSSLD